MPKILVIGVGAAGNKAAINLIEKDVMRKEDVLLVNSSKTDIKNLSNDESTYMDCYVNLYEGVDGCAKERKAAGQMTLSAFAKDTLDLKTKLLKNGYEKVILVTSIEGGTGSGSTPIIADMIKREINDNKKLPNINIEIVAFKGFGKDIVGLKNSVNFFNDLNKYLGKNYTLQIICNELFLKEARNQLEAQKMANDEFAQRVRILSGQLLNNGNDNNCSNIIDGSDLFRYTCAPGYSTVEYIEITDKIVSKDDYNDLINKMIDSSKSPSISESSESQEDMRTKYFKVSVIANIQNSSRNYVDYDNNVIRERFGEIIEMYDQFYSDPNKPEFVALILRGLKRPSDIIIDMGEEYQKRTKNINTFEDDYDEALKSMESIIDDDDDFDMIKNMRVFNTSPQPADTKVSDDFLNSFRVEKNEDDLEIELSKNKKKKSIKSNNILITPTDESDF